MFSDKKILLTAFSPLPESEAKALYDYLKRNGANDISTTFWGGDEVRSRIPEDVNAIPVDKPGDIQRVDFTPYDIIFRHQTLSPNWLPADDRVTTATNIFFERCPARVIGVTGTKGKGTTATLIHKMLSNAGITTHLVGNIGIPALSEIENIHSQDVVVFEMSSFQLWDFDNRPHTAVMLMIAPEHLDVHSSLIDYVAAKARITVHQKADDLLIYHPYNQYVKGIVAQSSAQTRPFMEQPGAHIEERCIVIEDQKICNANEVGISGAHNLENACAAVTAAWKYTQDSAAIAEAIKQFKGLPHRLEVVAQKRGVTYVDDSISTTSPSAVAAMKTYESPKIMILGGSDKGVAFTDFANAAVDQNVKKALLIGQTAPVIAKELEGNGIEYELMQDASMLQIVRRAAELADEGDVVLLSPACASFGMFKNYKDRANQFIDAVADLPD